MSQVTTAPTPTPFVSVKLTKAVQSVLSLDAKSAVAFDNLRQVAKSECLAHAITEKAPLTALLLVAGLDKSRVSEIVGFVFPASASARKELDKALAINAGAKVPKERIAKPVLLALQRDKTGTLTLEKAIAEHKPQERAPGGVTAQTATTAPTPTKAKMTPQECDDHLGSLIAAALNWALANGYGIEDYHAVSEAWEVQIFPDEGDGSI